MKKILVLLTLYLATMSVQASLMIAPIRVMFDERTRSAKVSLINSSNETKTYKLYWRHLMQTQEGGYQELTDEQKRYFPLVDRMVRFSPRAVTLKPQEKQSVRLSLRRPDSLQPGEFRSHLTFEAIDTGDNATQETQGTGIQLKMNMAFSIPVIVRYKVDNANIDIGKTEFFSITHNEEVQSLAQFPLINKGNISSFGNVKAYWLQSTGQFSTTPTGILNNIAVFSENPQRFINLRLKETPRTSGRLKIVYEGVNEFNGQIFDEIIVNVDAKDFLTN